MRKLLSSLLLIALGSAAHAADGTDSDAWSAANLMGTGINIGNTLENTTTWETGWGNPPITKEYVESLAALGYKTVRLPVAWDTYARDGVIQPEKFARVNEVVDWITGAGMYCVINIHWDGGWIDSSNKDKYASTYATFSADAERKFRSYWKQIATRFADKSDQVIFEALNEETNFEKAGSVRDAFATLTRVNQAFIDTVRATGGGNPARLLIVTGYATDFTKTASGDYQLPRDTVPHKLLISVHYYTPWQFVGMTEDANWGKMMPTWGSPENFAELNRLFDLMQEFSKRNDIPVFIGEYGATDKKAALQRARWMSAVTWSALARGMVPVLWDTGGDVSRKPPYAASGALSLVLKSPAIAVDCPAVTDVQTMPMKFNTGFDAVDDRLTYDATCEVSLLGQLTNDTGMKDPRQAPPDGRFAVGDAALFYVLQRHGIPIESVLPAEYARTWKDQGVYAYFDYVNSPGGRQAAAAKVKELVARSR